MPNGRLHYRRLRRRFRVPLRTGAGEVESVDRIVLRIEDARGVGFGEVAPWPGFPVESADVAQAALRESGEDPARLRAILRVRGGDLPCLAAAVAMADDWAAIRACVVDLPCAALLAAGAGADEARRRLDEGYRCLKLKVTAEDSTATAEAILGMLPAGTTLRLDANGSLRLDGARTWAALARSSAAIEFLEQPLPPNHAGYLSLGPDKIALDESVANPARSRDAARWEGFVVLKPALAGDWPATEAWARARAGKVVVSSAFETAIGRQAALTWAARLGESRAVGFDTLGRFESDGRDRHEAGPRAQSRTDIDWEAFWDATT